MNTKTLALSIGVLILLIAIFTNPNQSRHKEVVISKFNAIMQKSMQEKQKENEAKGSDEFTKAGEAIGMMLGSTLIEKIIDNVVTTDNYLLFSTTNISWDGKSKVIGIGAFGNVFISGKLDETIKEGMAPNPENPLN